MNIKKCKDGGCNLLVITNNIYDVDIEGIFNILPVVEGRDYFKKIYVATVSSDDNARLLHIKQDTIEAKRFDVEHNYENNDWWYLDNETIQVDSLDIVLLMIDRINTGHRIMLKENFKHSLMVNDPLGINLTANKKYLLNFGGLTPVSQLINSSEGLDSFIELVGEVVLKPLDSNGGRGLVRVNNASIYFEDRECTYKDGIDEVHLRIEREAMLGMEYLDGVREGDKRIIVCDGKVIATILRKPKGGSWLCNLSMGGTFEIGVEVTSDEVVIIDRVSLDLEDKGIFIYGLDTLFDNKKQKRVLSEINTSNVGGILNPEITTKYVDGLIEYINQRI